jgi:peptide/nickel transport system substrate-binding protein
VSVTLVRFLIVLVLALGCSKPSTPVKKNRVVIGITQEPDTLWMPMKQMNASEHVGRPSALSLTIFDDKWQLVPWAAEAIPQPELLGDGAMRVTWKLRDGLFWADGHPVTSDDFAFTWKLYNDPNLEIVDRTVAERVKAMDTPDPKTLVVTFKEPYAYYAVFRNHEVVPKHIVEPLYAKLGAKLKEDRFGTQPILGGGFTIAEWSPGSHVTAKRNPHAVYFKPKLDEIVWKIIPQTTALEASILSGSIDAISVIGLTFDQALAFEERAKAANLEVIYTDALHIEHLEVNMEHPVLKDRRVREALLLAIDRDKIVQTLFKGKQPVAHGTEPERSQYFNPNLPRRTYDPEKAKALLAEAGVKDLKLTLMTTAGDKVRDLVSQLLVAHWKEVGIEVNVIAQPAKIFFGDTIRHRKFPDIAMFTWSKDPIQINESFWRCDQIPSEKNGWRGQNYPGYCNPSVDTLLARMTRELDPEKRKQLGQDLERILADDLPWLPLYFRKEVSVIPKGFKGWRPTGLLEGQAWNAHEWEWP